MTKSNVIANCLVNSNQDIDLPSAETLVRDHFRIFFSGSSFDDWNSELEPSTSNHVIQTVGAANFLDIESFIRYLWNF